MLLLYISDVGELTGAVDITDFSIANAKIGENANVSFTIHVKEELTGDPRLNVTIVGGDGTEIPCLFGFGTW